MSKSKEILKVIANVLDTDLNVPEFKDSSFIGAAMNTLKALDYFKDYRSFIEEFIKFEIISSDSSISEKYKEIYAQWKNIKNKVDKL
jgi:sugar (pentulose or hexulose) kinase